MDGGVAGKCWALILERQRRMFFARINSHIPNFFPQALSALYFFLAGLLVKGHPWMWLLPLVS